MNHSVSFKNVTKKYNKSATTTSDHEESNFYALKDIDFTALAGELIGVIGSNGAGKSTFANLITGVISPASGELDVEGKSFIVSTDSGLNDQLTGRENIELQCMTQGYGKRAINKMMPEIINFAGISDYIDYKISDYPSELNSRLLFAISIQIDPDIIVIDEGLPRDDKAFADKCMEKMIEFKNQGKTIFFISHDLEQIETYCQRVVWLEAGQIKVSGPVAEVISQYREFLKKTTPYHRETDKIQQTRRSRLKEKQD